MSKHDESRRAFLIGTAVGAGAVAGAGLVPDALAQTQAQHNAADAAAWADGAHALLKSVTVSGTRDEVRERLATLAEQGVTEIVYQPAGPDIRRELETFMEAASTSRPR